MYDILQLNDMLVPELKELAEKLDVKGFKRLNKQDLIYKILDQQAIAGENAAPSPASKEAAEKKPKKKASKANDKKKADARNENTTVKSSSNNDEWEDVSIEDKGNPGKDALDESRDSQKKLSKLEELEKETEIGIEIMIEEDATMITDQIIIKSKEEIKEDKTTEIKTIEDRMTEGKTKIEHLKNLNSKSNLTV